MAGVYALVAVAVVLAVTAVIVASISLATSEPLVPTRALRTPAEAVPRAQDIPPPRPVEARRPTPRASSRGTTGTVIRLPTSPKQVRTTPKSPGQKVAKLYMLDSKGAKLRLLENIAEPIVDVCYFNNGLLVLLAYGNLVYLTREGDTVLEYQLPATEPIICLSAFNGQVVGLSEDGHLYAFTFFNEDNYDWAPVLPGLGDITYINTSSKGDCLWIQTPTVGVAYDATADVIDREDLTKDTVRIYGEDASEYITIDRSTTTGKIHSTSRSVETVDEVYTGTWLNHEFIRVGYDHYLSGVQRVRSIGPSLYYVLQA